VNEEVEGRYLENGPSPTKKSLIFGTGWDMKKKLTKKPICCLITSNRLLSRWQGRRKVVESVSSENKVCDAMVLCFYSPLFVYERGSG